MQKVRATAGAWLWVGCVQFFLAEQWVARAFHGAAAQPYNFAKNYVSDLGAATCTGDVCSPLHLWMDASFVLQGLLIFAGALLVRGLFSLRRSYTVGLGLLAASGLGVLVVGLAPEDVSTAVHFWGALLHFVSAGVGMVMLGALMLRDARRSPVGGAASLLLGVVVLAATGLLGMEGMPVWKALGLGVGTVERVAAYGVPLWFIGMGIGLLRRRVPNV